MTSLIKKAVEEHSLMGDLMGGKECQGSLRNNEIVSSMKKGMQPPNHKESTVFGEAYKETVADKSATDMAEMM